jgi:hypothetical protein
VACRDPNEQLTEAVRVLSDLRSRYKSESLAVIYGQYFNPSFKGPSKEEEALRTHPEVGKAYRFASITKGREYFAGVLYVSSTFLSKRTTEQADRLRLNTLYVALTRFRDEVTVIYVSGCPVAGLLEEAGTEAMVREAGAPHGTPIEAETTPG